MGIFSDDRIQDAKGTEGGVYFLPGWYELEIQRCKEGVTYTKKQFFVAECSILKSDNPERKVGTPCSFMVTFDKYPDLSLGNVADFMRAAMSAKLLDTGTDVPPEKFQITKQLANEIVGESNPLAGVKLKLFAFNKPTKEKKDFTRHRWYRLGDKISAEDQAESQTQKSAPAPTPAPPPPSALTPFQEKVAKLVAMGLPQAAAEAAAKAGA